MLNIESDKQNTIAFTGKETASSNLTYYLLELDHIGTTNTYLIALNINNDISANKDRLNVFYWSCPSSYKLGDYNYKIFEGTGSIPNNNNLTTANLDLLETGKAKITGDEIVTETEYAPTTTETIYEGQGS